MWAPELLEATENVVLHVVVAVVELIQMRCSIIADVLFAGDPDLLDSNVEDSREIEDLDN